MRNIILVIAICAHLPESSSVVFKNKIVAQSAALPPLPRTILKWTVSLTRAAIKPPQIFCGGTLISKSFVISAAHCVHQKHATSKLLPRDILAIFGADKEFDEADTYQLSPKNIFIHENWNPWTTDYDGDLSLLQFSEGSIRINNFVQPICLGHPVESWKKGIVVQTRENSAGVYGVKPAIRFASTKPKDQCVLAEQAHLNLPSLRTFCGTAGGDSGGGFFVEVFQHYYHFAGVESLSPSSSPSCNDCEENAIYTNVLEFRGWIEKTVRRSSASQLRIQTPRIIQALKQVSCKIEMCTPQVCNFNETIDSEDYVFGSELDYDVERFEINDNTNVLHLPRLIGEKFSSLKEFSVYRCGLTIVRDFYFKKMMRLQSLFLNENKIAIIEPEAFSDLVEVASLGLEENLIESFDEKLFQTMIKLDSLYLLGNKIKFLSPSTLDIPGASLKYLDLKNNVCIDEFYSVRGPGTEQLESDLIAKCVPASWKVSCNYRYNICMVRTPIDREGYVLASSRNTTVKRFDIGNNRKVKHLPKHIGALFPNLQGFWADKCALTIVRNFYFQDMQNLRFLYLQGNKIETIEPKAFMDLTSVKKLWLHYNMLETLDKKLFRAMVKLEKLNLSHNRIQFFDSATLTNKKLDAVFFKGNICIDGNYFSNNMTQLKDDLAVKCRDEVSF